MSHNWQYRKMPTVTKSLTAMSLSCLAEGLDEEAVDVDNRAENRERARREAMVLQQSTQSAAWNDESMTGISHARDRRLFVNAVVQVDICALL
jgi:hypothetical protein